MTDVLPRSSTTKLPKIASSGSLRRYESLIGLLFLSPWILGFVLLKVYPILTALWYSFSNFHMLNPADAKFIGLTNYVRALTDLNAWSSMAWSLGYFLVTVPLELLAALALAAFFSSGRLRAKGFLRPLYFMPSIIPAAAIGIIYYGFIANSATTTSWLNILITTPLKLPPILDNYYLFVAIMSLWSIGPGFFIMYGAMQGIPKELHEAARVDGAGPLMRFISITLPIISPAIFFSLVISLTSAFGGSVLLDRGYVFSYSISAMENYINRTMFTDSDLGYASALTWLMFAVTMTITIILFRSARRWVYFPEESGYESI